VDILSDVLRSIRLSGAIFFNLRAAAPWVAETPAGGSIVRTMFPGSDHLMLYHLVVRGAAWIAVPGEDSLQLAAGDIIVLPHGDAHTLASAPGLHSQPDISLYRPPADRQLPVRVTMGDPRHEATEIVCGFLGCDRRPYNPLLAALPRLIRVNAEQGGPLATYVHIALAESQQPRPGGQTVLGHLSELMFVDVVRRYLEGLPPDQSGWLAGLRDPYVGRALAALHRDPAQGWTIESLAQRVGLSRSALAERFTQFVGQPPMQYLANWRMQLAAQQLRGGTDQVAVIANRVGYESEAAFSRAFKKAAGAAPSTWRQRAAASAAGD